MHNCLLKGFNVTVDLVISWLALLVIKHYSLDRGERTCQISIWLASGQKVMFPHTPESTWAHLYSRNAVFLSGKLLLINLANRMNKMNDESILKGKNVFLTFWRDSLVRYYNFIVLYQLILRLTRISNSSKYTVSCVSNGSLGTSKGSPFYAPRAITQVTWNWPI